MIKITNRARLLLILFSMLWLWSLNPLLAQESTLVLDNARIETSDLASLQRGARLFVNFCSGCHSLKYVRYSTMAKDIGIVNAKGQILEAVLKDSLIFTGDSIHDTMQSAMTKQDGALWFGVPPPDLSLVSRARGVDWLYTYLRSFYPDPKRPWGTNNRLFPEVAMPDVLESLRTRFYAEQNGQEKFDAAILDIVNFLSYAGEPTRPFRQQVGIWVILFLGIFCVFACLLKREYWKDIH